MLNSRDKEKAWKAVRIKQLIMQKRTLIIADILSETMEVRKAVGGHIQNTESKKIPQLRILQ